MPGWTTRLTIAVEHEPAQGGPLTASTGYCLLAMRDGRLAIACQCEGCPDILSLEVVPEALPVLLRWHDALVPRLLPFPAVSVASADAVSDLRPAIR